MNPTEIDAQTLRQIREKYRGFAPHAGHSVEGLCETPRGNSSSDFFLIATYCLTCHTVISVSPVPREIAEVLEEYYRTHSVVTVK